MAAPVPADDVARVCHEANRALQHLAGETVGPPWDDAPDWQRASAAAGVDAARDGAGPRELHAAWCDHKTATGWTYGPRKDEAARTHPCLVPYDELPEAQRRKDAVFAAIVAALTPQEDTP